MLAAHTAGLPARSHCELRELLHCPSPPRSTSTTSPLLAVGGLSSIAARDAHGLEVGGGGLVLAVMKKVPAKHCRRRRPARVARTTTRRARCPEELPRPGTKAGDERVGGRARDEPLRDDRDAARRWPQELARAERQADDEV